jgi:hypothetical protein
VRRESLGRETRPPEMIANIAHYLIPQANSHGINEIDREVGEVGVGRFEMRGDSVFRAGDDLKIAENAAGQGSGLIDGNARLSVGGGISVSSGGTNKPTLTTSVTAVVDSGNSMGPAIRPVTRTKGI